MGFVSQKMKRQFSLTTRINMLITVCYLALTYRKHKKVYRTNFFIKNSFVYSFIVEKKDIFQACRRLIVINLNYKLINA